MKKPSKHAVPSPSRSPARAGGPCANFVLTINSNPTEASASASRKLGRGRSPHSAHAPSVTTMGAQFASSVEAATEVSRSEACHKARSPAKNTPAQKNIGSRQLRSVGVAAGGGAARGGPPAGGGGGRGRAPPPPPPRPPPPAPTRPPP